MKQSNESVQSKQSISAKQSAGSGKKHYDTTLLVVIWILVAVGLVLMYSTSSYNGLTKFHDRFYYLKKQGFATILGLVGMFVTAGIDYHKWSRFAPAAYVLSLIHISDQVRQYMKAVVDYGTGTSAQVEGYEIGGKTGTAEKLPRGNGNYLLSFIGYAPVENPEVVIYVVIDEPNVENQSVSSYIMELSQKIMAKAFPYLNITRSESATATGGNGSSQNDYQDYDSSYEDNYSNDSGYYEDESGSYDPDYTD